MSNGNVDHLGFLGSVIRYRVKVGGHFILVDVPHQQGERALPEGTPVTLGLNANQVIGLDQVIFGKAEYDKP